MDIILFGVVLLCIVYGESTLHNICTFTTLEKSKDLELTDFS